LEALKKKKINSNLFEFSQKKKKKKYGYLRF